MCLVSEDSVQTHRKFLWFALGLTSFVLFFWPGLGSPDVYRINGHGSCPVEAPGCACLARLKMWEVEVRADEKNLIYLIYRRKEKWA